MIFLIIFINAVVVFIYYLNLRIVNAIDLHASNKNKSCCIRLYGYGKARALLL